MTSNTLTRRTPAFWIMASFLAISIPLMLAGQTLSVFDYELTTRLGLQEARDQVGAYGVQFNKAFAVADTVVYLPLIVLSLSGLITRKRWALFTTAAFAGASIYWTVTIAAAFRLLPEVESYVYQPPFQIWLFVVVYFLFGVWALAYLIWRGERLLSDVERKRLIDLLLVDSL